jgi:hypothetical protein
MHAKGLQLKSCKTALICKVLYAVSAVPIFLCNALRRLEAFKTGETYDVAL